jgi:Holliday junction resolvase RusA-like endonuclease
MIYVYLEGLPPSANQAYFNLPSKKTNKGVQRGGRGLTKAGKAYKQAVVQHIVQHHAMQTGQLKKEASIGMLTAYGFPNMLSKGYPQEAKHRFIKQDLANRPKLLQDAICEATVIDDSQICFDYKYKYQSGIEETRIWIWNEDEEPIGQQLLGAFSTIAGYTRAL